ncbi:helix-turn-helix domain-containing protein [Actinomadura xylanilytica]|uniref:helix-turn-helix domain-containing protein n=1 Tax=Actinomadura xylanilytica TaxID=887459 RepID=UPI00255B13EB|nr:helix-turn-helix transcriptional regulator [Actinomadura xylanilytica]MDL4776559.1 helix-turn-helix transcriptional regulator [Actinomadura xylanilytica]
MAHPNRPSVRFRRIGGALRQAREDARLTIDTASRRFGRSPDWFSTVENGLHLIRVDDLGELLDFYGITEGPLRDSLIHLAAQGRRKNWTRAFQGRISPAALDLASLEADSASIHTFQPNLVPGLLQTQDYTRAVMAAGLPGAVEDIDSLVDFRMARQAVLNQPDAPRYDAIISESVLGHQVGNPSIMHGQLMHLARVATLSHIGLHVLPNSASAYLWISVPFNIFTLRPPGQLTVVVADQVTQFAFTEDDAGVEAHNEIYDHLLSVTLDQPRSLEVIQRLVSDS